MRRALVLAALVAPALAVAQSVPAPPGGVVEIDNFNSAAVPQASYVNEAQCAGGLMNLEWNILAATGGTYRLFASNTEPGEGGFCPEENDSAASPQVFAGSILPAGSVVVEGQAQGETVSGATVATAAQRACSAAGEGQVIWICAHWYNANGARSGAASGRFLVQVAAPAPPTGVSAGSGDTRLHVRWDASTGGAVTADRYVAEATPVAGGPAIRSESVAAQSVTLSGLVNDQEYSVVVFALSVGRNESEPSAAVTGTPRPVDDFFEVYRRTPGAREEGGCGAGGTGPLALVAVGLLALLRRRK
jgi:uncharacterized protein (TIGR03382 family)